jgi:hypothetical protein
MEYGGDSIHPIFFLQLACIQPDVKVMVLTTAIHALGNIVEHIDMMPYS